MLYVPSIFGEDLMDDWFDDFDRNFYGTRNPLYGKHARNLMKTDVREKDNAYLVSVDLPGFKKENIQLNLKDGYLTITANKELNKEETEKESGKLVRQERYAGTMSRSFYVGEEMTVEDIKAKYEDGVLTLTVPKKEEVKKVETPTTIMIE